ncbi:TPA: SHOCT domain-containing protein [Bacillus tropicus]|nr:SHOCT domain-containing protein [Bacillus tropicus]
MSVADELKKFKGLLQMGVITEDGFNAKKKQLLNI